MPLPPSLDRLTVSPTFLPPPAVIEIPRGSKVRSVAAPARWIGGGANAAPPLWFLSPRKRKRAHDASSLPPSLPLSPGQVRTRQGTLRTEHKWGRREAGALLKLGRAPNEKWSPSARRRPALPRSPTPRVVPATLHARRRPVRCREPRLGAPCRNQGAAGAAARRRPKSRAARLCPPSTDRSDPLSSPPSQTTGLLYVDRILYSSVIYPSNYGEREKRETKVGGWKGD